MRAGPKKTHAAGWARRQRHWVAVRRAGRGATPGCSRLHRSCCADPEELGRRIGPGSVQASVARRAGFCGLEVQHWAEPVQREERRPLPLPIEDAPRHLLKMGSCARSGMWMPSGLRFPLLRLRSATSSNAGWEANSAMVGARCAAALVAARCFHVGAPPAGPSWSRLARSTGFDLRLCFGATVVCTHLVGI